MKFDRYVDLRLENWGLWRVKFVSNGLGYPSTSATFKIKEDGTAVFESSQDNVLVNPQAEEVDKCINALSRVYPRYADAVKIRYTAISEKEELKKRNLKYGSYLVNLRLGKMWVASRLGLC
jgi:hypothetical protein